MSKWGIWMLAKMTGKGNVFQFLCILKISSQVFRWLMSATFREKAERKLPWLWQSCQLSEKRLLWNWNMPSSSLWDSGTKVFEFSQGLMDRWHLFSVLSVLFYLEPFHTSVWRRSLPLFQVVSSSGQQLHALFLLPSRDKRVTTVIPVWYVNWY